MLKTYIIILMSCIGFAGEVQASEHQKSACQQNQGVKKASEGHALQTLPPIKEVHGPVIKIYEDGTRETNFNDGTGTILVENSQGFYYSFHQEGHRLHKK